MRPPLLERSRRNSFVGGTVRKSMAGPVCWKEATAILPQNRIHRNQMRGFSLVVKREFTFRSQSLKAARGDQWARAAYISPPAPSETWDSEKSRRDALDAVPEGTSAEELFTGRRTETPPLLTARLVASLLFREKGRLFLALVALFGSTTCTLIMPQFSGRFFETLIGRRDGPLPKLLTSLAVVYCLEPLFTIAYVSSLCNVWEKVMAALRSHTFRRLLVQKVEFYDRHNVSELTSILSTELASIEKVVTENVSRDRGLRAFSEMLGTLAILWTLSPHLAPVFGFLIFSISVGVAMYKRTTAPVFRQHAAAQAKIAEKAAESFSAIRTVRSFGGERRQMAAFDEQTEVVRKSGSRLGWLKSANESWTRVAIYCSLMVVYMLGGAKVKAGELPVGTMVAFIGYTFTLTFAVQGLVNTLADFRNVLSAVSRINAMAATASPDAYLEVGLEREERGDIASCRDEDTHLPGPPGAAGRAGPSAARSTWAASNVCQLAWSGDLVLEDVSFSYPQRPDQEILQAVNLRLPCGTVTALVGASGAGKSTVVQLLSRFYEPIQGRISLAGHDVREFDKSEWARAVSLVNQEPVLFQMSVRDNIAYGMPNEDVTDAEILEAAKAANAHEFVMKLPEGYDTMVGERGGLLSGGQRQRVAIARALLKDAPILILDEATSALDSVSERLVQDALQRLMKGRTTLVIAHRLSTVQSANQIAVLSSGHVIELGSHLDLVAKGGSYANLVNSQRLSFE